jgi:hypothetical protein
MLFGFDGRRFWQAEDDLLITELWLDAVEEDAPDPEDFSGKIAAHHWKYIAKRLTSKVGRYVGPQHAKARWKRLCSSTRPRWSNLAKYGWKEPLNYEDFLYETTYERNDLKRSASLQFKRDFLKPVYEVLDLIEKEIPGCWTVFNGKLNEVWTFWVHMHAETVTCCWDPEQDIFAIQYFADPREAKTLRPKVQAIFDNSCENTCWDNYAHIRTCKRPAEQYRMTGARGLHVKRFCNRCASTKTVEKITKEEVGVYKIMES